MMKPCVILCIWIVVILLGRPQQYDTQDLYDGRLKQYTIWVDGKKKILLPLVENPEENLCTIVRVCLVKGNNFVKDVVILGKLIRIR